MPLPSKYRRRVPQRGRPPRSWSNSSLSWGRRISCQENERFNLVSHSNSISLSPVIRAAAPEVKVAVALGISRADGADELVLAEVDLDAGVGGVLEGAVDVDDLGVGDVGGQEVRVDVHQAPGKLESLRIISSLPQS